MLERFLHSLLRQAHQPHLLIGFGTGIDQIVRECPEGFLGFLPGPSQLAELKIGLSSCHLAQGADEKVAGIPRNGNRSESLGRASKQQP